MLEDLRSFVVFDQEPSPLPRHNPYLSGVRIAEAFEHSRNGVAEGFVQKSPPVFAEQLRAGVLVRHSLSVMLDIVSTVIVFEIVLKTVEDSGQVLALFSVAEGDQLEQSVKGQWREGHRRATFDLDRDGMRHNLAEAGHVEHEAFFQLETPVRG